MSTGIGNHKIVESNHQKGGAYSQPIAICPYCEYDDCRADFVDVGVGMVQCGPYYCPRCEASEISSRDARELTEREKEAGRYEPHSPVSETANSYHGELVDHKTAKDLYGGGLLD